MADVSIDMSEVRTFAADLGNMPAELTRHALPAMKKGAQRIKETMRSDMAASGSFGHLARSITYDEPSAGAGGWETEIGPVKKFSGKKRPPRHGANIAYFGTSKGGGTVRDPMEAAQEEMPAFEQAVADVIEELI